MIQPSHYWVCSKDLNTLNQRDTLHYVTAALVRIAKTWTQPRCPWLDEWIKTMWPLYAIEYYLAIKNGILPFAAKWTQLEDITLNEISWTQKDRYYMFSLMETKILKSKHKIVSVCQYHGKCSFVKLCFRPLWNQ